MSSISAQATWHISLYDDGRAEHSLLIKVFRVSDAVTRAARSTITVSFPSDRPVEVCHYSATLTRNGQQFHTTIRAQDRLNERTGQFTIGIPELVSRALGLNESSAIGKNIGDDDLALEICLEAVESGAVVDSSFSKNEKVYDFRCCADASFSSAEVIISVGTKLGWYRRTIVPLAVFLAYWRKKRYDIQAHGAGQLPNWKIDDVVGTLKCTAKRLNRPDDPCVRISFRPVPFPGPMTFVRSIGHLILAWVKIIP